MIFDLLTHFGDLITSVWVHFNEASRIVGEEIVRIINERSFQSLKLLVLFDCKGNVLKHLNNPFPNVKYLVFSTNWLDNFVIENKTKKMNYIFPKLAHFHAQYTNLDDWSFIDGFFPNLTWFEFALQISKNDVQKRALSFLKNNPQIDKLSVYNGNCHFFKDVNDILPKFQILEILVPVRDQLNTSQCDKVHFENVKELLIDSRFLREVPRTIIFDELIKLTISTSFDSKWLQLMKEQINEKLAILSVFSKILSKEHLLEIPEKLPHLCLIEINSESIFNAIDIIQFINKNKDMTAVEFNIQMNVTEQKHLEQIIIDYEWNIEIISITGFDEVKIFLER